MASGGFLRVPRVRVFWGDINLSAYDGPSKGAPEVFSLDTEKGGPIVYDVRTDLASEGEGPTAELKWDPTGPGYDAYEWFLGQEKYVQGKFSIEFFYPRGKKIVMFYKWSGQTINYGNDMSITVKLQSELAGLVNANQRNTAQAYDENKGVTAISAFDRTTKQFGLSSQKDIIAYNKYAKEQLEKVKYQNIYGSDQVYSSAVANLAKQSGHTVQANNIGGSNLIIFPPYSYKEKGAEDQEVLNGATDIPAGKAPDPKIRYGYLLGPSIINSVSRSYNWKPPQQSNSKTPGTQTKPDKPRDKNTGRFITAAEAALQNKETAAAQTSSPIGTSNGKANPGVQNKENPYGPDRQNALNQEKSAEMTFDTVMCPVLTGIKPNDIVFIPSLKGDFIEDWIVQNVDYTQNDGSISVSIKATRTFGVKNTMNQTAAKKFLEFAKTSGLVGPGATLDSWDKYAWSLPGESQTTFATTSSRYDTKELDG